ncbi:MAG: NAD(P)H-binding protein [Capnocytophaga sp.]|nr:NAD(P)H-binding protein [Capnocytophaga sp.]
MKKTLFFIIAILLTQTIYSQTDKNNKMKNVLIIGASGSLAKHVIDTLQNVDNVHLTLLARSKNRIAGVNDTIGTTVIEADVLKYDQLKKAVENQDIIYVNLSGDLDTMSKNIIKAMKENNVKRVIAISSIGIYETPLKPILKPYRALADNFEASGLDYTILRPDWFTNADEVEYALTRKGQPESGSAISRKSIAAFVATLVQNPELYVKENLGISKP